MKKFLSLFLVLFIPLFFPHSYGAPSPSAVLPNTRIVKIIWIDESFNNHEKMLITYAAQAWEDATKGIVKFPIVNDRREAQEEFIRQSKDTILDVEILNVEKVSKYDLITLLLDAAIKGETLGFYNEHSKPASILLITDRFESNTEFREVTMHELGHALALEHIQTPNTLMYPSEDKSADCITLEDLEQFCSIYRCDPYQLEFCDP